MALCTELSHPALIHLVEIILESKCIFMVFEYAEHDYCKSFITTLSSIEHHYPQGPYAAACTSY